MAWRPTPVLSYVTPLGFSLILSLLARSLTPLLSLFKLLRYVISCDISQFHSHLSLATLSLYSNFLGFSLISFLVNFHISFIISAKDIIKLLN